MNDATTCPGTTQASEPDAHPVIGITANFEDGQFQVREAYVNRVLNAGGMPIILPHVVEHLEQHLRLCDGIIVTGGDDPNMESFGGTTHPASTRVHPQRQAYEVALLRSVAPETPVLGICLGMQWMTLLAGGDFDQHLPGSLPTAEDHREDRLHSIEGSIGMGTVASSHRQGFRSAGTLEVIGRAHDGLIEAVRDSKRPFYVGVQWHPERTDDPVLGEGIFTRLVEACRESMCRTSGDTVAAHNSKCEAIAPTIAHPTDDEPVSDPGPPQ
ncbi:MAG: gamma-glutamyl-gamma-aminobutyrate hydrolase family protein [Planctomycetota bacterium]